MELSLYKYKGSSNVLVNYSFCSAAFHIGDSWASGHYVSICKTGNKFYKFDDDQVYESIPEECNASDAYLYFYQICDQQGNDKFEIL